MNCLHSDDHGADAALAGRLKSYAVARGSRSLIELAVTLIPLVAISIAAFLMVGHAIWWGLALIVPAAGFLVRLFMIQHDCGHGSFFRWKWLNDWLGRSLAVFTLTPYDYWRRAHAMHHTSSGSLDRRTIGGITTLTVDEYRALPPRKRLAYWLYRHPLVMFGLGPAFVFILQNRLPVGMMRQGWRPWLSTQGTNLAVLALSVGMILAFGIVPFLIFWVPVTMLAASIGVWLFFVQHQFEDTYWARRPAWNANAAALHGSSHYDLPPVLRWFTANIGIHHVHHLNSRIPFYRLDHILRDEPQLRALGRLTLMQSLRCVGLALWDEPVERLVSFRNVRREATA